MKKKTLSLALALALCLGLTVPAFAASTLTGNQLNGDWNNGPSLTLTGVVGEAETPFDPPYIYDVEVGGSLVLEMTYPAGRNRSYSIMNGGFYVPHDLKEPNWDDPAAMAAMDEGWNIPASAEGGDFDESNGKTRYVYNFTESDVGQKGGMDKIIYPMIYWCDDVNNDGQIGSGETDGSVYFGIRVVPAKSPAQPEQPTGVKTANPTNDKLEVNGAGKAPTVYKIDGSNYFKIRDVAAVLNGTEKQFAVGYSGGKVTVTSGQPYETTGTELKGAPAASGSASPSNDAIVIDGVETGLTIYKIDGSNYFKLRDLGEALDFYVGWEAGRGVYIETDKPYSE